MPDLEALAATAFVGGAAVKCPGELNFDTCRALLAEAHLGPEGPVCKDPKSRTCPTWKASSSRVAAAGFGFEPLNGKQDFLRLLVREKGRRNCSGRSGQGNFSFSIFLFYSFIILNDCVKPALSKEKNRVGHEDWEKKMAE